MRILVFSLFLSLTSTAWGQSLTGDTLRLKQSLGIGTTSFNAKAALEVKSTTKYVLLPKMTTTEKNAISSPDQGAILFDSVLGKYQYYNSGWTDFGFVSPMTTAGDLIYRGVSGDNRLGIGTTGQILTVTGGAPVWSSSIVGIGLTTRDNLFAIQDDGDPAKQAKFEASGLTSGATRTFTFPDSSGILATTNTLQTFTNKILTSPDLTNPTVSGPIQMNNQTTPTTPGTSAVKIYTDATTKDLTVLNDQGAAERYRSDYYYPNFLENGGFEKGTYQWTASGGTLSTAASGSNFMKIGQLNGTWDSSAAAQTLTSTAFTIGNGQAGQNGLAKIRIMTPSGTATHTIGLWDGTNLTNTVTVPSTTTATTVEIPFIFGASGTTVALRITSVNANEPLISLDDGYIGYNTNIGTIAQATRIGTIKWAGATNCVWSSTSTSFTNFAADTDCSTPTSSGSVSAPGTKIPAIIIPSIGPGVIRLFASGSFRKLSTVDTTVNFRFSDGTTGTASNSVYPGTTSNGVPIITGELVYTSPQTNLTIQIQGRTGSASDSVAIQNEGSLQDLEISAYYFPSTAETAARSSNQTFPTVQKFLSGSGTYTRPNGVTHIRVRMVGGGGGGTGSASTLAGMQTGGNGTASTFGTSLLSAGGGFGVGVSGTAAPGQGGTSSLGTGPVGIALTGGVGGGGFGVVASFTSGAVGGSSALGGGGKGPGGTNTGGGGAGADAPSSGTAGGGGGSGGYVDAIIYNPLSTYSYTVGAGGTAGPAGSGGTAGTAGGSGQIIVEEFYGMNAPVVIGSVTSNSSGSERIERVRVTSTCSSSPCTIADQSGSWVSSIVRTGTGAYTLNIASGIFSNPPTCTCTPRTMNGGLCRTYSTPTSTAWYFLTQVGTTDTDMPGIDIICMGPR